MTSASLVSAQTDRQRSGLVLTRFGLLRGMHIRGDGRFRSTPYNGVRRCTGVARGWQETLAANHHPMVRPWVRPAGDDAVTLGVAPERCPSGLRSATGNRVRAERCVAGSNPALSAPALRAGRTLTGETMFPPWALLPRVRPGEGGQNRVGSLERRRRDSNPRWRHSSP